MGFLLGEPPHMEPHMGGGSKILMRHISSYFYVPIFCMENLMGLPRSLNFFGVPPAGLNIPAKPFFFAG